MSAVTELRGEVARLADLSERIRHVPDEGQPGIQELARCLGSLAELIEGADDLQGAREVLVNAGHEEVVATLDSREYLQGVIDTIRGTADSLEEWLREWGVT